MHVLDADVRATVASHALFFELPSIRWGSSRPLSVQEICISAALKSTMPYSGAGLQIWRKSSTTTGQVTIVVTNKQTTNKQQQQQQPPFFVWTLSGRALLIAGELYRPWHETVQKTSMWRTLIQSQLLIRHQDGRGYKIKDRIKEERQPATLMQLRTYLYKGAALTEATPK